jgi:transcriptional antiterminator RfaH
MAFKISQGIVNSRCSLPKPVLNDGWAQETWNSHWFLVQLKPNGFERAKKNLSQQSFETFMPMQDISLRRRGRLSAATRPLFPGYLFVQIPPSMPDWRAVNSTYGVSRLVTLGNGRTTEVPTDLMFALRTRCDIEGRLQAPENLTAGKQVRIIDGPFSQHIAEIEAVVPGDRVVLLMQLMGQIVRAKVKAGALEVL